MIRTDKNKPTENTAFFVDASKFPLWVLILSILSSPVFMIINNYLTIKSYIIKKPISWEHGDKV